MLSASPTDLSKTKEEDEKVLPGKVHHVTIAMVPPPENAQSVWRIVNDMRRQMKDPGFFRWPPHANLMYPFLNIPPQHAAEQGTIFEETLEKLHSATRQIEPFSVRLQELGTFGGKQRGVLWLKPDSSIDGQSAPLLELHEKLEQAFPMCKDQTKGGRFTPHMTISHFENLQDALAAKETIEKDYKDALSGSTLDFMVDRIYWLHRQGDEGQFLRMAEIGLGADSTVKGLLRPPEAFPEMPVKEEEWVYEERMKLKARRNGGRRGRGGRGQQRRRSREPRVPDTPEEIAAKRATRKAKKECAERQQEG